MFDHVHTECGHICEVKRNLAEHPLTGCRAAYGDDWLTS